MASDRGCLQPTVVRQRPLKVQPPKRMKNSSDLQVSERVRKTCGRARAVRNPQSPALHHAWTRRVRRHECNNNKRRPSLETHNNRSTPSTDSAGPEEEDEESNGELKVETGPGLLTSGGFKTDNFSSGQSEQRQERFLEKATRRRK
ncbi:hypothetical protein RRG08_064656 [Elysia crispata]|uniref:Uncharacterized protein n=1 Tax=Elysia crispata TaxID=231223 RepID=A0AAE1EDJ4_9GAST|nr:hypothetical protein RRG08_064656 [Elysia crispata]